MKHLIIYVHLLSFCVFTGIADELSLKLLCLGDSLTEGYGVLKDEAFPALLQKQFTEKGLSVKVINSGQSGSTSKNGLKRLKWLSKMKPDYVLLALGANDGLRGLDLREMQANLKSVIEYALVNKIKVILAGMKIPPNYGPEYTQEFENIYFRLAEQYEIPLIPFLLEGVAGQRELNLPDGIHPTSQGQNIVASNVMKVLLPLITKELSNE